MTVQQVNTTALIQTAGFVIAELFHVDVTKAEPVIQALTNLVSSHGNPDVAIASLTSTIQSTAGMFPQNPTLQFANKIVSEYASAKANFESGQAVVLASPKIDGREGLIVLVEKGGVAAQALGV